jgi:hypothetical protein
MLLEHEINIIVGIIIFFFGRDLGSSGYARISQFSAFIAARKRL